MPAPTGSGSTERVRADAVGRKFPRRLEPSFMLLLSPDMISKSFDIRTSSLEPALERPAERASPPFGRALGLIVLLSTSAVLWALIFAGARALLAQLGIL